MYEFQVDGVKTDKVCEEKLPLARWSRHICVIKT